MSSVGRVGQCETVLCEKQSEDLWGNSLINTTYIFAPKVTHAIYVKSSQFTRKNVLLNDCFPYLVMIGSQVVTAACNVMADQVPFVYASTYLAPSHQGDKQLLDPGHMHA